MDDSLVLERQAPCQLTASDERLAFEIGPDQELADRIVARLGSFLKHESFLSAYGVSIVLQELLKNAVARVREYNFEDTITGEVVRRSDGVIQISVQDNAEGLDANLLDWERGLQTKQMPASGYALINALSESVEFNDAGNRVTAHVRATAPAEPIPAGPMPL